MRKSTQSSNGNLMITQRINRRANMAFELLPVWLESPHPSISPKTAEKIDFVSTEALFLHLAAS